MNTNTTPLTSHAVPSFFQPWALRALSETGDSRNSSPNVSPSCLDHLGRQQEVEASYSKKSRRPRSRDPSHHNAREAYAWLDAITDKFTEDPGALDTTFNPSETSTSRRAGSKSSSKSGRARKLFRLPDLRIASKARKEGPPSPQAMSEQEVARSMRKKHQSRGVLFSASEGASTDMSVSVSTFGNHQQPLAKPDNAYPRTVEQAAFPASSDNTKHQSKSLPQWSSGREGLYSRSKRLWKSFSRASSFDSKLETSILRADTKTLLLLDSASVALARGPAQQHTPPSPETTASARSTTSRLLRGSNKPATSSSSSVRKLMMGKPPVNTPDSDALYGGEDSRKYFKVEISDPDGPTFLPSEARRIGTPPLPSDGPRHGRLRGFFFDYRAPNAEDMPEDGEDTLRPVAESLPSTKVVAAARSPGQTDWFSVVMMVEDARDNEEHFELNVPEHLLGSPLCPRSQMHKSGGKGICVYHGRN